MKKHLAALVVATASFALSPTLGSAQPYPSKPIRIVVPFEAGGAMDIIMRVVSKRVMDTGGPAIVIENKTGAGGAIGVVAVKEAAPDGYTLAEVSSSTHVLNPHTTANIPYDPVKDFQPITMLVKVPTLLTVPAGSPANSLKDLIELARNRPDGLNYGSAGVGSAPHITAALLQKSANVPMTHIPYKGMAGAMNDVLGGRLDFVFSSIPSLGGTVADGKVRLLGVAGKSRIKDFPNIPSMAELGHPDVDVDLWFGLVAPATTDPAIVRTLNEMFVKATNAPELAERFKQLGVEIATGTPEQFRHALVSENARLGPFVRQLTAKPQ